VDKRDVVLVTGARTAIGDFGGALKDVPPTKLAAHVVREVMKRANLEPSIVEHVVFGHVIPTEPADMYLARVAALDGGLGHHTPALTLNRLCGSGLQAIISTAQMIALGDIEIGIAGGAESMSRGAYVLPNQRFGQRSGNGTTIDMMIGALTDPFDNVHMGITAERIAERYGVGRERQDEFAVESHRRATRAIAEGRFAAQIAPLELAQRKSTITFGTDEHARADVRIDALSQLRPPFQQPGTVTAGNASSINDGAAAVVLMSRAAAERRGERPLATLVAYAHAGVDPKFMGMGPVPAVKRALERANVSIEQIDVIESNEAFASQACAVADALHFDPAKLNPNGGAIALGHPVGATGCILAIKAVYELERIAGRYALVTLCIGGGQGIAAIFERA
jgi:acetyl-CoA C-acetyltransferase